MITKQDWETSLKQQEEILDGMDKSYEMQKPQIEHLITFLKSKVAEFPDEDPMPEDVKEVIKEATTK